MRHKWAQFDRDHPSLVRCEHCGLVRRAYGFGGHPSIHLYYVQPAPVWCDDAAAPPCAPQEAPTTQKGEKRPMIPHEWQAPAQWTDDCQGKKDYDGPVVDISTRYWPRSGGFAFFMVESGRLVEDPPIDGPATATASILLRRRGKYEEEPDTYTVAEGKFEGETFEDVKVQVEAWVQAQYQRVIAAVLAAFAQEAPATPAERP